MGALQDLIRELVKRKGGRAAVAAALGIKTNTLGHWITGERRPDFQQFAALLKACDATVAEWVTAGQLSAELWAARRQPVQLQRTPLQAAS